MSEFKEFKIDKKVIKSLKNQGVGVLPTDTLYGLVGSALSKKAVERIYKLKNRDTKKPMIILIADFQDLALFGVRIGTGISPSLKRFWPGKVSVVLPLLQGQGRDRDIPVPFDYLHRGKNSLAFRLPEPKWLRELLRKTGPLVAPSANPEGEPPAETITQAKKYFACPVGSRSDSFRGDRVDFYMNGGTLKSKPSTLIKIKNGRVIILRQGTVEVRPL